MRKIATIEDALSLLDEWVAHAEALEDRLFHVELQLTIARAELLLEHYPPPVDVPVLEADPFG